MRPNPRCFDRPLHMAHLQHASYTPSALSGSSSFDHSYNAIEQVGYGRGSTTSPEARYHLLHGEIPQRPSIGSIPSYSAVTHSCSTLPQRQPTAPTLATTHSIACSRTSSLRPSIPYLADAHAVCVAEHIGYKTRHRETRSMMGDQGKRLKNGKSDNVLRTRARKYEDRVYNEDLVGPYIRFRDPQTGAPRLTMVETIEQHQQLGRRRLEGQRRMDQCQQRLKTVYETIEEQEIIDGRPQRGVDNVQHEWASYF